ncbi:MAG: hypothetical protein IVW57_18740 [Ktedonobacterales bacterium]|nr:hypothetical protein [Ktedonobacterales bacterium]
MHIDSRASTAPALAKIIPIRRDAWLLAESRPLPVADRERGRHFLKVTLPAIPVAVFTLTFLLAYFLRAGDGSAQNGFIDPLPALLMALMLTGVMCVLCAAIYSGYKHVTGISDEPGA